MDGGTADKPLSVTATFLPLAWSTMNLHHRSASKGARGKPQTPKHPVTLPLNFAPGLDHTPSAFCLCPTYASSGDMGGSFGSEATGPDRDLPNPFIYTNGAPPQSLSALTVAGVQKVAGWRS
jgi:hypothetical protein